MEEKAERKVEQKVEPPQREGAPQSLVHRLIDYVDHLAEADTNRLRRLTQDLNQYTQFLDTGRLRISGPIYVSSRYAPGWNEIPGIQIGPIFKDRLRGYVDIVMRKKDADYWPRWRLPDDTVFLVSRSSDDDPRQSSWACVYAYQVVLDSKTFRIVLQQVPEQQRTPAEPPPTVRWNLSRFINCDRSPVNYFESRGWGSWAVEQARAQQSCEGCEAYLKGREATVLPYNGSPVVTGEIASMPKWQVPLTAKAIAEAMLTRLYRSYVQYIYALAHAPRPARFLVSNPPPPPAR